MNIGKKYFKKTYLIILFFLFSTLFQSMNVVAPENPPGIFLIDDADGWELAGFNSSGKPVYFNEALLSFFMPVALKKEDIHSLKDKDVKHTITNIKGNFTKRLRYIDFEILESSTYYVVLYHMEVKASTDSFSIDFIPKIKGEELPKFAYWNSSWSYKRNITINHNYINTNLTNFPVIIPGGDFGTIIDLIKNHCRTDGMDIAFTDSTETIQLYHELEYYNVNNYMMEIWVNIPFISSTTDTIIWMYYGNDDAPPQENQYNTWDDSYHLVSHYTYESLSTFLDSTQYVKNLVSYLNFATFGKIIGGVIMNNNQIITTSYLWNSELDFDLKTADGITIESWIRPLTIAPGYFEFSNKSGIFLGNFTNPGVNNGAVCLRLVNKTGNMTFEALFCTDINNNYISAFYDKWTYTPIFYYVVGVFNETDVRLYVNGVEVGHNNETLGNPSFDNFHANQNNLIISQDRSFSPWSTTHFYGMLDETRISNVIRNSSWISASYYNQNYNDIEPGYFLSFGNEIPSTGEESIIFGRNINSAFIGILFIVSCFSIMLFFTYNKKSKKNNKRW